MKKSIAKTPVSKAVQASFDYDAQIEKLSITKPSDFAELKLASLKLFKSTKSKAVTEGRAKNAIAKHFKLTPSEMSASFKYKEKQIVEIEQKMSEGKAKMFQVVCWHYHHNADCQDSPTKLWARCSDDLRKRSALMNNGRASGDSQLMKYIDELFSWKLFFANPESEL